MGENGRKWLGKQSKCSKLVKKSSELSQNVPKCPKLSQNPKMSQNVHFRRIVVRTDLFYLTLLPTLHTQLHLRWMKIFRLLKVQKLHWFRHQNRRLNCWKFLNAIQHVKKPNNNSPNNNSHNTNSHRHRLNSRYKISHCHNNNQWGPCLNRISKDSMYPTWWKYSRLGQSSVSGIMWYNQDSASESKNCRVMSGTNCWCWYSSF